MLATCFCMVCKVPKKRFQVQLLITGVQRENCVKWGSSRAKELHSDSSAFHNMTTAAKVDTRHVDSVLISHLKQWNAGPECLCPHWCNNVLVQCRGLHWTVVVAYWKSSITCLVFITDFSQNWHSFLWKHEGTISGILLAQNIKSIRNWPLLLVLDWIPVMHFNFVGLNQSLISNLFNHK